MAAGRSLVITLGPERETQLEDMDPSERGRPFAYSDLLMGGIAYLRYMIGKGVRIAQGMGGKVQAGGSAAQTT